jgi:hypothetical protein
MNWTGIWNRLWRLLEMPAPCYFSGPRFLAFIREVDPDLPQYGELMEAHCCGCCRWPPVTRKYWLTSATILSLDHVPKASREMPYSEI